MYNLQVPGAYPQSPVCNVHQQWPVGMKISRGLILQAPLISRRQLHVVSSSRTNVKPASPTPLKLKHYNLPSHDLMMPDYYMPLILFYPNPQLSNPLASKTAILSLLKNSLSKTLSEYYPFAGRLSSSGSYVDCNDEGIHFLEAQIACDLSEILQKPPVKNEKEGYGHLFPPGSIWHNVSYSRNLMAVQLNHFSCGGLAIAVSLSHRVADGVTLFSVASYWARMCRNLNDQEKLVHRSPCFVHELLLPQSSDDDLTATQSVAPEKNWITTKIVLSNSNIDKLKAELEMQDKQQGIKNKNYTRNELVTALLYRCAVTAATASNSGTYTKSVLLQTVNMRPVIDPPLPKTSVGNLFTFNHIPTYTMNETKLNTFVAQMRKGMMQLRGSKSMVGIEAFPLIVKYEKLNYKTYMISSIRKLPIYDETDFGWGRPVKAAVVDTPFVNSSFMMDTPSRDGITATVSLEEQDMKNFLANKELLAYASL
ncbi:diaboline synthase-like [Apium graveolens]|uniref:diaboline synthase-like n=1 Tax=Apium graveolens TaxID=4045 RepID=UPI003D7BEA22